jgi:hypothetical protein
MNPQLELIEGRGRYLTMYYVHVFDEDGDLTNASEDFHNSRDAYAYARMTHNSLRTFGYTVKLVSHKLVPKIPLTWKIRGFFHIRLSRFKWWLLKKLK